MAKLNRAAVAIIVLLCLIGGGRHIVIELSYDGYYPDYSVFWTAARMAVSRPEALYDMVAVTEAQRWLLDPELGPRPWAYPPSALLIFFPFALLPFAPSLAAWGLVSITVFVAAARRYADWRAIALALISPPVVWNLLSGQTALLTGGAILAAVAITPKRPVAAGILLGVTAAFKPQAMLLAPLALARGRHWTALAAAGASGCAMLLGSLAFGLDLWFAWAAALGEFSRIVELMNLHRFGVTPYSIAYLLELPAAGRLAVQLAGVAAGVWIVWHAFGGDALHLRAAALIGGSLLCSPYAMTYELAMLAPIAAAGVLSGQIWGALGGIALVGSGGLLSVVALLASQTVMDRQRRAALLAPPE